MQCKPSRHIAHNSTTLPHSSKLKKKLQGCLLSSALLIILQQEHIIMLLIMQISLAPCYLLSFRPNSFSYHHFKNKPNVCSSQCNIPIFNHVHIRFLCWCLHLVVVEEFEYPSNPESYAVGSLANGRATLGGQVEG